jgi:sec-independent protein translocase protein TatA
MDLGMPELVIIFLVVLLLFGAGRLPQVGAGLGKAIRGFKDAVAGKDEAPQSTGTDPTPTSKAS